MLYEKILIIRLIFYLIFKNVLLFTLIFYQIFIEFNDSEFEILSLFNI